MEITIPARNQLELFKNWLLFLNPILKLREETELPILASYVALAFNHRDYNPDTLSSLLFSKETQEGIREKLGFSERSFLKHMDSLISKGFIETRTLTSGEAVPTRLNPRVIPKDFVLKFNFKIG